MIVSMLAKVHISAISRYYLNYSHTLYGHIMQINRGGRMSGGRLSGGLMFGGLMSGGLMSAHLSVRIAVALAVCCDVIWRQNMIVC